MAYDLQNRGKGLSKKQQKQEQAKSKAKKGISTISFVPGPLPLFGGSGLGTKLTYHWYYLVH